MSPYSSHCISFLSFFPPFLCFFRHMKEKHQRGAEVTLKSFLTSAMKHKVNEMQENVSFPHRGGVDLHVSGHM